MKEKIVNALEGIAKEKGVEILLACETGSRAWGFPSPDSDYDVRFIYAHPADWYLSLNEKRDAIDLMEDNRMLDLSGWDLRKTLRLLAKSNVSVLERMQSPMVYHGNSEFTAELNEVAQICFSPIATMHHYLSMSKAFLEKIKSADDVKLKDYFYALRTAMAGWWIRERGTIPPLVFTKMFDLLKPDLQDKLTDLIALKSEQDESYRHMADEELNQMLMTITAENEAGAKGLPSVKPDWARLDQFFLKWIK